MDTVEEILKVALVRDQKTLEKNFEKVLSVLPKVKRFMVIREEEKRFVFLADLQTKTFSGFFSDGVLLTENSAKQIKNSLQKKHPELIFGILES